MKIENFAGDVVMHIQGHIIGNDDKEVYNWFGYDSTCPREIDEGLANAGGKNIVLKINSPGGCICAGSAIYTALKNYRGKIVAEIVGWACSAASFIAMACFSRMSPTALMMLHNVQGAASGDYRQLAHTAEVLRVANEAIVNAYELKTKLPRDCLCDYLNAETWLTAKEAMRLGFVDEVMFAEGADEMTLKNCLKNTLSGISNAMPTFSGERLSEIKARLAQGEQPPQPQATVVSPPLLSIDESVSFFDMATMRFALEKARFGL